MTEFRGLFVTQETALLHFSTFVDIEYVESLLHSFSQLTGIAAALSTPDGEILAATGWQRICSEFHRKNSISAQRCLESDTSLAKNIAEGTKFNIYKCKNGLIEVAAPIYISGNHLGNLYLGQFLLAQPEHDFFDKQAIELGFDKDQYLKCIDEIPVLPEEKLNIFVDYLINTTTIVARYGYINKQYIEINNNLEKIIKERTEELEYSNKRYRALTEASFESIVILEDGLIVDANDNTLKMFGYQNVGEIFGKPSSEFIEKTHRDDVIIKIENEYDQPYESIGLKSNGETFPVEIIGKTFRYHDRKVRGVSIRDLSVQKNAEKEIHVLRGILPICCFCKKIRNDKGYWEQIEKYIDQHSEARFSHGLCPECRQKHYPLFLNNSDSGKY